MLQTLAAGPAQPTYGDIALERGVTATRPFDRRRRRCRRPPGTPSSRTSTTTASSTCSSPRATSTHRPSTRAEDPSNLLPRPARRHVRRRRPRPPASSTSPRPRRRPGRPQPRRPARPRRGQLRRAASGSGGTSAPATPRHRAPMGHWLGLRLDQPGAEPRRDRRLDRGQASATGRSVAELDGRRRPRRRPARLDPLRARAAPTTREVRVHWPDGEVGPWLHVGGRPARRSIERGATAVRPWQPPAS